MTAFLSAGTVGERALRKIGAFTTNDVGADPNELAVAMDNFDMVIGHYMSTSQFRFLIPATFSLSLVGAQADYDLKVTLGADWPTDGLIFPLERGLSLVDDAGNRSPLTMVRRDEWEQLERNQSGTPDSIYFDRSDPRTMVMRTFPTLGTGVTGWAIEIAAQRFAKTVDSSVNPTVATGLPNAWNLWAVTALAYAIGDGPIRQIESTRLDRWRKDRDGQFDDLKKFANREHADDPICAPWGT